MRQVKAAYISAAGVLYAEREDGGLEPWIPLHPVATMMEKLGLENEAEKLRALVVLD